MQTLGIGVHGIHDAATAGAKRANIEVVRSGYRIAYQFVGRHKDRHDKGYVWAVAGAVIGRVMDDDITRIQHVAALFEQFMHSFHIARNRTALKRCALL